MSKAGEDAPCERVWEACACCSWRCIGRIDEGAVNEEDDDNEAAAADADEATEERAAAIGDSAPMRTSGSSSPSSTFKQATGADAVGAADEMPFESFTPCRSEESESAAEFVAPRRAAAGCG